MAREYLKLIVTKTSNNLTIPQMGTELINLYRFCMSVSILIFAPPPLLLIFLFAPFRKCRRNISHAEHTLINTCPIVSNSRICRIFTQTQKKETDIVQFQLRSIFIIFFSLSFRFSSILHSSRSKFLDY